MPDRRYREQRSGESEARFCGASQLRDPRSMSGHKERTTSDQGQWDANDLDKRRNRESGFRHPPIDFSRRQIRLIRVLRSQPDAPIRCKFALTTVNKYPASYTALSYTWGSASQGEDLVMIILHKQEFWVRHNLWCFLRQVRDDSELSPHWYWIDAVCIDQAETGSNGHQEKNHQVNMMGRIYSKAQSVMTWLGEPAREDHAALHALQRFTKGTLTHGHRDKIPEALRYLGSSTYWSRIWIIQEFVLARNIDLRVGHFEFSWGDIYRMRTNPPPTRLWRVQHDMGWPMTNVLDVRHAWSNGETLDLQTILHDFGIQKCSDPRDRIYGLLGLMGRKPCRADYSKSCVALYVEIVTWALEQRSLILPSESIHGLWHLHSLCGRMCEWSSKLELTRYDFVQALAQLESVFKLRPLLIHSRREECGTFFDRWRDLHPYGDRTGFLTTWEKSRLVSG